MNNMEKEKLYIISAYTENQVGLLSTVAGMFTRRSINIDTLRVMASTIPGVHKFSVKTRTTESKVKSIVLNMEKKVDVIKAFYYVDNENSMHEIEEVSSFLNERENNK